MSLEQAIVQWIKGDSAGVNADIAGRVYPIQGHQAEDIRPFLAYDVTGGDSMDCHDGPATYRRSNVEFTIVADTFAACADLSDKLRALLDGKAFTATNERIAPSILDDETDIEQGPLPSTDLKVYMRLQTYRMLHRPN